MVNMKTIVQSNTIKTNFINTNSLRVKEYLIKPFKAGFFGFATILFVLFFINMLSFIFGSAENFGMDLMDMLLAGVGFFLQLSGALLKSFVR